VLQCDGSIARLAKILPLAASTTLTQPPRATISGTQCFPYTGFIKELGIALVYFRMRLVLPTYTLLAEYTGMPGETRSVSPLCSVSPSSRLRKRSFSPAPEQSLSTALLDLNQVSHWGNTGAVVDRGLAGATYRMRDAAQRGGLAMAFSGVAKLSKGTEMACAPMLTSPCLSI
jgi:hypothetical protein